uniref:Uncharacterized protein n=1 Tax=Sphaerodactylus townsendi TaxID=933632 RepID=A0ACB8ED64_9SAUR
MSVGIRAEREFLTSYTPHITPQNLEGKITASTFVLAQPRCYFEVDDYDRIWLLVARSDALKGASVGDQEEPASNLELKSGQRDQDTAVSPLPPALNST